MKGNNDLILNEATLIDAMQEYLSKRYTDPIKVMSVKQTGNGYETKFTVAVERAEPVTP